MLITPDSYQLPVKLITCMLERRRMRIIREPSRDGDMLNVIVVCERNQVQQGPTKPGLVRGKPVSAPFTIRPRVTMSGTLYPARDRTESPKRAGSGVGGLGGIARPEERGGRTKLNELNLNMRIIMPLD